MYTINNELAKQLITMDMYSDSTTAYKIFFEWFSHMKLDSEATVDTNIQKRP